MDLFRDIIINVGLMFAFLFLINFPNFTSYDKSLRRGITRGLIFGFSTIVVMMNAWQMQTGAIFDTRTVIVSVVALLFSNMTAIITALIAIAYRIYVGGIGVYAGILSIFTAAAVGMLWKRFFYRKTKMPFMLELYLFGIVVHIFMLLSQFAFPYPTNIEVLQKVSLIVMLVYPVAVTLVTASIVIHDSHVETQKLLLKSEKKYRTVFDENPLGMFQYDTSGIIQLANEKFSQVLQTSLSNLIGLDMHMLPNKKLVKLLDESLEGNVTVYKDFYESYFSGHRAYVLVQFFPLISEDELIGGIGIVQDLSESYKNQETIDLLTSTDILTKLYNRQSFDNDLWKKRSAKSLPVAIIVGDINTFQIVNESFGYEAGNVVLIKIAELFNQFTGKSAKAYRIGGDEFALIMNNTDEAKGQKI
ncbi:MAG TPA: diguanylate cyclase, partial [Bacillota bacterium]|nr:diguanylate cyclase [Bacillota bacterium]